MHYYSRIKTLNRPKKKIDYGLENRSQYSKLAEQIVKILTKSLTTQLVGKPLNLTQTNPTT